MRRLASVPVYFGLRVASGLLLLKLSASLLPVGGFAMFSQFMLFAALLNLVAVGGAQNGLIRQAAAASDADALARTQSAALLIWAVAAPTFAVVISLASGALAVVLVGETAQWPVVIAIAVLALASGPGQIWCSLLTGRTRVGSSLGAQAVGLLVSTGAAAWFIRRGDAAGAAIAFASGGLAMMAAAAAFASALRIPRAPIAAARGEVRALLRYSGAFAATTGFSALVLFGLRWVYRGAFGTIELGHWLAANRISDMSTQLLGLFMIQFVVPQLAMTRNEADRRLLLVRCAGAGALAMGAVLVVFSLAARPLVQVFLSPAFVPAIPTIQAYMTGDLLRVWASLAMYAAFARGRPDRYAAIEIGALTLMAAITVALIAAHHPAAPQVGYVGAYAVIAALVTTAFLKRSPAPSAAPAR